MTPDADQNAQRRLDLNNEQDETKRRESIDDEDAPLTKRYLMALLQGMGIVLPGEEQKKESVNTGLSMLKFCYSHAIAKCTLLVVINIYIMLYD
jgi:hypothetical protein